MRCIAPALLTLAFASTSSSQLDAQDYWGSSCHFEFTDGYETRELGLGWAFAVDVYASRGDDSSSGSEDNATATDQLPPVRLLFTRTNVSPSELATQYFAAELPMMVDAGWQQAGQGEALERTFFANEEGAQDKLAQGQLARFSSGADASRTAEVTLLTWEESNGSRGMFRGIATNDQERELVAQVLDSLSSRGISESTRRTIRYEELEFSIPAAWQHAVTVKDPSETLLQMGSNIGSIEVLIGAIEPQQVEEKVKLLRPRTADRFRQLEESGAGKMGEVRTTWFWRGSEVLPISVLDWQSQEQAAIEVRTAILSVNQRLIYAQSLPQPGQGDRCANEMDRLLTSGIKGGDAKSDWSSVQLPGVVASVPAAWRPDCRSLAGSPGLLLKQPGLGFNFWVGSMPAEDEEGLADDVSGWLRQWVTDRGYDADPERFDLDEVMVACADDLDTGFDGMAMPRVRYVHRYSGGARVFTATVYPFAQRWVVAIAEGDVRLQAELDELCKRFIQQCRWWEAPAEGRLSSLANSRFPLRYPSLGWVEWSRGDSESSEAKLYSDWGRLELSHNRLSDEHVADFDAFDDTKSGQSLLVTAELSQMARSLTPSTRATRFVGGEFRDWHGANFVRNDNPMRAVSSSWLNGDQRYRMNYVYQLDRFTGERGEVIDPLQNFEINGVRGAQANQPLPRGVVPFGGTWLSVPQRFDVSEEWEIENGVAVTVDSANAEGWRVTQYTFVAEEDEPDDSVWQRLWSADRSVPWFGGIAPEAEAGTQLWLGTEAPFQRSAGRTSDGRPYVVEHTMHREGKLCRVWTVHADELAFDVMRPQIDEIRTRAQLGGGIAELVAPGEARAVEFGGASWNLPMPYSDPIENDERISVLSHSAELGLLQHAVLPDTDDAALIHVSTVRNQGTSDIAELRQRNQSFLVELHGKLYSATKYANGDSMAALAVVQVGGKPHVVICSMFLDPVQKLLEVLHGAPAP